MATPVRPAQDVQRSWPVVCTEKAASDSDEGYAALMEAHRKAMNSKGTNPTPKPHGDPGMAY